jgi:hypothetical protein
MGYSQLVISRNYDHAYQIDYEEPLINCIDLIEKVSPIKLELESIHAPEYHESYLG